jgi:hypothetical protein
VSTPLAALRDASDTSRTVRYGAARTEAVRRFNYLGANPRAVVICDGADFQARASLRSDPGSGLNTVTVSAAHRKKKNARM